MHSLNHLKNLQTINYVKITNELFVINAPEGNIVHLLVKTRQQDMKGHKTLISLK